MVEKTDGISISGSKSKDRVWNYLFFLFWAGCVTIETYGAISITLSQAEGCLFCCAARSIYE